MTKYEVMFIVPANADEEVINNVKAEMASAFTSNGATILNTKDYGLKDLAYEIKGMNKGFYVWFEVEANGDACKEFTRRANINENIIRHIVVKED